VAAFLTSEWVEQVEPLLADLGGLGDPGERVQIVVTGGPDGDVRLGAADDPDLVLTTTTEVARELLDGTLDPNVAFMQGRLKTAGDNALLLRILPRTRSDAFAARRAQLQSLTD
jgi:putative sterol carrier protein